MATVIKKGKKKIVLLNPAEKGRKAAAELRVGIHATNDQKVKRDKRGNAIPLTDTEKAYRSGYLAARRDSAKCWKAKRAKKKATAKKRG